ncbi:YceI family protein [uncultured Campylobacter sp.]|uniref:YceI family protein n=1 Tax=uncultured Campylobacter sp. TaxID=218934 RepID=UPI00260EE255|nr:YceI family protein [uncultured Campylobacter sp.]
MKKIISGALVTSILAASAFAFSVDGNPSVKFVGYKLANKTAVEGTFKDLGFKSAENANFADFLKTFEFNIDPKNIDTKLPDRDKRIGIIFDGNAITAKIVSVSGDEKAGEAEVEVSVKGNSKAYKTQYTVESGKLKAKIGIDLLADFKLDETFAKFATASKAFHGGKSYPDVEISLEAKIK